MIGRLEGVIQYKSVESVVIDVKGVGYEVTCPLTVLDRLPPEGQRATLTIHTHVREDQITLFAFNDRAQRALFLMLTTVSGVGPKLAMAVLSTLSPEDLRSALVDEDIKRLCGVPGVGKRTAERLVLELKEKARKQIIADGPAKAPGADGGAHLDDLDSALRNLGFRPKDVDTLIAGLRDEAAGMSFEDLLREALRRLNG